MRKVGPTFPYVHVTVLSHHFPSAFAKNIPISLRL